MVGNRSIQLEVAIPDILGDIVGRAIQQHLEGKTLEQVIGRFAGGPVRRGTSSSGTPERYYPILLPPDDGLWLALPTIGTVGFSNDQGQLQILCPMSGGAWMLKHLGQRVRSTVPDGNTLNIWVKTQPGPILQIPVFGLFSVRIQVPEPGRTPGRLDSPT